jgi:hypothetical protein
MAIRATRKMGKTTKTDKPNDIGLTSPQNELSLNLGDDQGQAAAA